MKVGVTYDLCLDANLTYANRVRVLKDSGEPRANLDTPGLFAPYFSAYRLWREKGLGAIEDSIAQDKSILAMTMDIEKFYHRVAPTFMVRPSFLEALGVKLSAAQLSFTKALLGAIRCWYQSTPDFEGRPEGAIPVGLSASKVIANVLLAEFDRRMRDDLHPIHYGRYVDDIFLVVEATQNDGDAADVLRRIAKAMSPLLVTQETGEGPPSLILKAPYARDSSVVFSGKKQKIFALSSEHGQDLVRHIREQVREQSSEYRLLPAVPHSATEMAARALLATPDATLQVDALRKADVVSVRRLGFSLLLSDIETYAADILPNGWRAVRFEFYELTRRHVLTPHGFFNYFGYLHRVFGLMLACGDLEEARALLDDFREVADLLLETTDLKSVRMRPQFDRCKEQYATAFLQAGIQALTARSVAPTSDYLRVLRRIKLVSKAVQVPGSLETLEKNAHETLLSDWGRRPYKDFWFSDQEHDEPGPAIPRAHSIRKQFRLAAIRKIRTESTRLPAPHWPALAFPTRPLKVDELVLVAPKLLEDSNLLREAIGVFRGARVRSVAELGYLDIDEFDRGIAFSIPGRRKVAPRIAVTSVETTDAQWAKAAKGRWDRSISRYERFNGLLNRILRDKPRPQYVVFPELSIPLRWAIRAARKLAANGVSLVAGVEYHKDRASKRLRNDCLVSLTTYWPGYPSSVVLLQPKFAPAHGEAKELKKLLGAKGSLYLPTGASGRPTIYRHRGFAFSILICSDLTNISHRDTLRGNVDAVVAIEWNMDTVTFGSLVESTASDLHAYVIQVNNRRFGDSRIRAPAKEAYDRDVVQVKGGLSDYYVLGELGIDRLRLEQARPRTAKPHFKPLPIGYRMSPERKP